MTGFARYPSLDGRVVLVTGGATGIGAEIVRQFAQQGARTAFLDLATDAGEALAAGLARDGAAPPLFLPCDLRDIDGLRARIGEIAEKLGPVEVLVNNAANDTRQDFGEVSLDDYEWAMQVNLRHVFFAIQEVVPGMRRLGRGAIVNMSSIAWMGGGARLAAYSAAKAAIVGLTSSLARELGPSNIRVNAIAPGAVLTPRQLRLWFDEARIAEVVGRQCLKRRLLEDEIARMVLFLAADDSRMITKQCMTVDAGLR